jgi:NADPH-dependent glutamate synthase beta subunit-like oxidoreductase
MAGFGGVAEYGITVRWDKNFLKVIRLLLERRAQFAMFGGVRFGGTLTVEDAFALGFDHIALCASAPGGRRARHPERPGARRAHRVDFLMALQLTGAAKADSIANMQLRLPVVVIGGGLTAIDTATESLAYYVVQVEKFLERYETLARESGEARCAPAGTRRGARDRRRVPRACPRDPRRARGGAREGRAPRIVELLHGWGGVTIAYRRG